MNDEKSTFTGKELRFLVGTSGNPSDAAMDQTPSQLFAELFAEVQASRLFADGKTFADAVPRRDPGSILEAYRARTPLERDALAAFVAENFDVPETGDAAAVEKSASLKAHIAALWPALTRQPATPAPFSSELALPHRFVVPGGRFREVYYWDSYFTMLGLLRDGHADVAGEMVENFADLIRRYGHVPNGSRTYYLSRSQPPFFYSMVELIGGADGLAKYLPSLLREYAFWMHGSETLRPGEASARCIAMPDGSILNRYWDSSDTPRDESRREDLELGGGLPRAEFYREIRAACESGWDFSSRWLADGVSLESIETTSIVPVDLNALLFGLERAIAAGAAHSGDNKISKLFAARAGKRKVAIDKYLWEGGAYQDWRGGARAGRLSAAMLYPLFTGAADDAQARAVAKTVRTHLLAAGGLATTTARTGQQWDAPNGWAPLQWIAVEGLRRHGEDDLAGKIARRWLGTVARVFRETGKLVEKYDVEVPKPGGGGEYTLQDGFGWTNGVTRALMDLYPDG